jgi:hypothetical protein
MFAASTGVRSGVRAYPCHQRSQEIDRIRGSAILARTGLPVRSPDVPARTRHRP